jgi:hypothetical protein
MTRFDDIETVHDVEIMIHRTRTTIERCKELNRPYGLASAQYLLKELMARRREMRHAR